MQKLLDDFYFLKLLVLTIFLVSLTWVYFFRVGEKSISIPKNDFLLSLG